MKRTREKGRKHVGRDESEMEEEENEAGVAGKGKMVIS